MRRLSHLTPAALAGMLGVTLPALAQAPPQDTVASTCHSHADLTEMLNQKFAELPSALGLQSNWHLVEVFVSNDGTSWTIVVTRPDGWSCIVAVGEHWESLPTRSPAPSLEPARDQLLPFQRSGLWTAAASTGDARQASSTYTNGVRRSGSLTLW